MPENVPEVVAPVIGIALIPVHVVIPLPAYADGDVPQVIVSVDVELLQPLVPVKVSVPVKVPLPTDGVNVADAAVAF